MNIKEELLDDLEMEFVQLERLVTQRTCRHTTEVEITVMGDVRRHLMCLRCSRVREIA